MSSFTRPELHNCALVTIDVQGEVLDGQPLEIPGSSAALPAIARLAEAFRARGRPIVHLVRRREAVINGWKALAPGTPGAELAAELRGDHAGLDAELLLRGEVQGIGEHEVVIYKPRWGAFYETPLHAHLTRLGVSTLAFCGFNFPNCPRTSIYQASERDFRVVLATDAVSGLYERGREELADIGVGLVTAGELIDSLSRSPAGAAVNG